MNLSGTINLAKLSETSFVVNEKGKKCICIPIEENDLFVNDKGVFLTITAWDNGTPDAYGKTHRIKQAFSKAFREKVDVKMKPYLGNFKELAMPNSTHTTPVAPMPTSTPTPTATATTVDDMPF